MKASLTTAAGVAWSSSAATARAAPSRPVRIRFGAIGLNHGQIDSQVHAVLRGGGELVSFFAREAGRRAAFQNRHRDARAAHGEREILEDDSLQLVLSAAIPDERAPLGIEVMRHGKDYMVDKPGITTLEQLADVRREDPAAGAVAAEPPPPAAPVTRPR